MYSVYVVKSGVYRLVLTSSKPIRYVYDYVLEHYLLYGFHGYIKNNIEDKIEIRF